MSDEYQIAHLDSIHVTKEPDEALTVDNKIEGLKTFNVSTTIEHVELKHLNTESGYSDHQAVWRSASATLEGEVKKGSATQKVLTDCLDDGSSFYIHVIDNPTAAAGKRKGKRYHMTIESGEEPREAGAVVTFSYGLLVKLKPTDILAS